MSIILKGIDMPKDDSFCMVVGITNAGSDVTIFYKDITKGKEYRGIEAKQIDRPHGRVIDGDKLKTRLYGYERWTGIDEAPYEYAENEVYNAPTILEAEEDER